ncbi:response regulator receiver domain protein [Bacteriovorax sp. BSW11_IV]|uniref:response regulator n=1 Tax=Bacteriovorax sp. BSW11_IV TaxID=1353529 RepID=UPI00038A211C|nr:response regulator [Bacteriovorax sp. BSW11_IV]EQC44577.1 response regulator receiver domain protein [Bacteriovorax sp. BSW11_IV]
MKLVICDDSAEDCLIIKTYLTSHLNCELLFYTDSGELVDDLNKIGQAHFILDLKMPKYNGMELLNIIKSHSSQTFVAIMSSSDNQEEMEKCLKLGANKYILKDMDLEKFGQAIIEIAWPND